MDLPVLHAGQARVNIQKTRQKFLIPQLHTYPKHTCLPEQAGARQGWRALSSPLPKQLLPC